MDDKALILSSMERMTVRQALEGMQDDVRESHLNGKISREGYDRVDTRLARVLVKLEQLDN